jgi:hypothetical protein
MLVIILEYAMKAIAVMGLWAAVLLAMAYGMFALAGLKFKRGKK